VGIAWSIQSIARARLALGETEDAVRRFTEGLALFRGLGHTRGAAWALYNLAWVAAERGRADEAETWLREGQAIFRELDFAPGIIACLVVEARLAVEQDPQQAARVLAEADAMQEATATMRAPADRARAERVSELLSSSTVGG
jgi:hypothetical protein